MARVCFLGSKVLGLALLRETVTAAHAGNHQLTAVLCPDDEADPRSVLQAFREMAASEGLELHIVGRTTQTVALLEEYRPDVVLVAGWYQLLPVRRLTDARFFGLHASPLPRYRGFAPIVWQMIAGEPEVGVSLFALGSGVDDGDIVGQATVPVGSDDVVSDVLRRVTEVSVALVRQHVRGVLDGTAALHPQDHASATWCGPRRPEDGRIDWHAPARRVHDFVRAQSRPYPGAFSALPNGRLVRIWRTRVDSRAFLGVPGRVSERSGDTVVVTCGNGAVQVLDVQLEGELPGPPGAVLDSLRLRLE